MIYEIITKALGVQNIKQRIKISYFGGSKSPTRVFQKSYQGFSEKVGPTRVFSYQGLLSPTRVFGRPEVDPRLSYQGCWSAAGRRPSERDANSSFETTAALDNS